MHAPALVVPGFKVDRERVTLAAFGPPPFHVVLPLKMLAPHHARSAPGAAATAVPTASPSGPPGGGAAAPNAGGGGVVGVLAADAGADADYMALDLDGIAAAAGLSPGAEGGAAEMTADAVAAVHAAAAAAAAEVEGDGG